jgi:hypothetical protein
MMMIWLVVTWLCEEFLEVGQPSRQCRVTEPLRRGKLKPSYLVTDRRTLRKTRIEGVWLSLYIQKPEKAGLRIEIEKTEKKIFKCIVGK